jgi:phage tail sheath protein FI
VETAIPAFIGFTQTATNLSTGDLLNVPTRITSMQDYEMYFGYGPSYTNLTVYLDNNNNPIISSPPSSSSDVVGSNEIRFYLYNSLRLFFDNGGGPCYIVSIGTGYTQTLSSLNAEDFIGDTTGYGLATLTKYDEPTLLLFPDAVNLPPVDLASVQQAALMQCGNITNRFCILDLCRVDKVATDFGSGENINTPFTGSIDTLNR